MVNIGIELLIDNCCTMHTVTNRLLTRSRSPYIFYFFTVIVLLLLFFAKGVHGQYGNAVGNWRIQYTNGVTDLYLGHKSAVDFNLTISNVDLSKEMDFYFLLDIADNKLATTKKRINRSEFTLKDPMTGLAYWQDVVPIVGHHFGYTELYAMLHPAVGALEHSNETLRVVVLREERIDDDIFTYTASALVVLMFINLGTALDLQRVKSIFMRPIGPIVGFLTRYALMPALGLGVGYLCFPHHNYLQLALFITALSPSGGLANICAVFLKGNINLSIATTTVNSLLALCMMPLWVMLLARVVYDDANLSVPFVRLAVGSVALILSIALGVVLRIFIPKTTQFIFRFLKPLSVVLSLCLIGLAVALNSFIFKELTVWIFLATFSLPIIGYCLSFLVSRILCLSKTDSLTIGIETSVLNMTVPIILLQYSLQDPQTDMVMVVPIFAALMSLCLVIVFYAVRRLFGCNVPIDDDAFHHKQFQ